MKISDQDEYEAAASRANAVSDAPEGSAAAELAELVAALRVWNEEHRAKTVMGRSQSTA